MAICSNCGAETTRVRSRWSDKGVQLRDECPGCAPQTFQKFSAPSDQKIAMGFEAHPNEYEKRYDQDGVFYIRKPEYRAEQEAKLAQQPEDELTAQTIAEHHKRQTRRTEPMREDELIAAIAKARDIAEALEQSNQAAQKEAQQAELDSWVRRAAQA